MLSENSWYINVIQVVITVNYGECMLLLYSPLNSYLYVHWTIIIILQIPNGAPQYYTQTCRHKT